MNESLQKPWVIAIEVPAEARDGWSYTVCGFYTYADAEKWLRKLTHIRRRYTSGKLDPEDEVSMPDGNVLFPTQIGELHLFSRVQP